VEQERDRIATFHKPILSYLIRQRKVRKVRKKDLVGNPEKKRGRKRKRESKREKERERERESGRRKRDIRVRRLRLLSRHHRTKLQFVRQTKKK
jgi:hypothetical protein